MSAGDCCCLGLVGALSDIAASQVDNDSSVGGENVSDALETLLGLIESAPGGGVAYPYVSGPLNLVAHGNSLTYGTGSTDPATLSWPMQMDLSGITGETVTVYGHGGWETTRLTTKIATEVIPYQVINRTNVLILQEAGNDIYYNGDPVLAWANTVDYIAQARSLGWKGVVAICTLTQRNVSSALLLAYNTLAREQYASAGFDYLVDIADDPALANPSFDGTHYNDAEYFIMGERFRDATFAYLGLP